MTKQIVITRCKECPYLHQWFDITEETKQVHSSCANPTGSLNLDIWKGGTVMILTDIDTISEKCKLKDLGDKSGWG